MKAIIPFLLIATSAGALEIADWALNPVKSKDGTPIGYVYNTYAVGIQIGAKTEKVVTDFRLVCSIKGQHDPMMAIRWAGYLYPAQGQFITISVDDTFTATEFWGQEGKTFFRSISISTKIMDAIKHGKQLKVSWIGTDAVRYNTIYNITNVNQKLGDFNTSCGTNI
jgi:hypothetical protein